MFLAAAALALAVVIAPPADVTGKWDGAITAQRPDGTTSEDAALLILQQKGSTISGTVGGSETDRHPITKGSIDGSKISLVAKNTNNEREYLIELTLDGDQMTGTVTMGERKGKLTLKRAKP
jgi:predicted dehydrogenase